MESVKLTNEQARNFLLAKHGLSVDHTFTGKQGALDYIRQAGCIQFDPIDVCGRNAELVLQSRVAGFTKQMLYDLLYLDRTLIDYFDKNLAILHVSDWKYFSRTRADHLSRGRSRDEVDAVSGEIKSIIREKGAVCSADLHFNDSVHWYWSNTRLSRAALETLYFRGELVIHHKKGNVKYYDLVDNCLPEAVLSEPDPNPLESDYLKWQVLRRISSVGLLWSRASDAYLNIDGLTAEKRSEAFAALLGEGAIMEVKVERYALLPLFTVPRRTQACSNPFGKTRPSPPGAIFLPRSTTCCGTASLSKPCSDSNIAGKSTRRPKTANSAIMCCQSCTATGS